MKRKNNLKKRIASAALSAVVASSASVANAVPAYAETDDSQNTEYEEYSEYGNSYDGYELSFDGGFDEDLEKEKEDDEEEENYNNENNNQDSYVNYQEYQPEEQQEENGFEENQVQEVVQQEVVQNELVNEEEQEEDIVEEEQEVIQEELNQEENQQEQQEVQVLFALGAAPQEVQEEITEEVMEGQEEQEEEQEEGKEEPTVVELSEELDNKILAAVAEEQALEETKQEEEQLLTRGAAQTEETPIVTKVAVVTSKVDDDGQPLVGATLQILDLDGNVLEEWISDGTEHVSMLPEGEYILHEAGAPEGYKTADDKPFTIKIETEEVTAGVVHNDDPSVCWHYSGVALYFVESEGQREEVYCVNQGWEEPSGQNYDGLVLDSTNIRSFTPDADTSMSDTELYNKVLDIIYHRSQAEELFPDLTETEIRFITEYALKTYTSAEVTTRQAKRNPDGSIMRDEEGNIVYDYIKFLRYYSYDPTNPKGYVVDPENGNGIGKLAEHWYNQHGKQQIPEKYIEFYNYLVGNDLVHPDDMSLYIYSTSVVTDEGEKYQNLLGVRWFDYNDEEYKTYLTIVDEKEPEPPTPPTPPTPPEPPTPPTPPTPPEPPTPPTPPCPPHYHYSNVPKTADESHTFEYALVMLCSGTGATLAAYLLGTDLKKQKALELTRKLK